MAGAKHEQAKKLLPVIKTQAEEKASLPNESMLSLPSKFDFEEKDASLQQSSQVTIGTSPNRSNWAEEKNRRLIEKHQDIGSQWKTIAKSFPGETDNSVKNQFFSLVRKSLRRAKKVVSKEVNPIEVNNIKPRVLSNILSRELTLPLSSLVKKQETLPELGFLFEPRVQLRKFIEFFAFASFKEEALCQHPQTISLIGQVLQELEKLNDEYVADELKKSSAKNGTPIHGARIKKVTLRPRSSRPDPLHKGQSLIPEAKLPRETQDEEPNLSENLLVQIQDQDFRDPFEGFSQGFFAQNSFAEDSSPKKLDFPEFRSAPFQPGSSERTAPAFDFSILGCGLEEEGLERSC